jgi:hypothetical protein
MWTRSNNKDVIPIFIVIYLLIVLFFHDHGGSNNGLIILHKASLYLWVHLKHKQQQPSRVHSLRRVQRVMVYFSAEVPRRS